MTCVYSVGWETSDTIKVILENPANNDGRDRATAAGAAAAVLDVDTDHLDWLDTIECDGDGGRLPRDASVDYPDRQPTSRVLFFEWNHRE